MKHPNEMSAAAINRELDAIDKKQSVLLDEFIAAGRGHERPSDWRDKTDPLSMKEKALSARRFDLMFEVRRRAGPGMYRLPKGFGPMKNPTTRKPGTVAAINRQIDAINRRANPALSEEDAAFVREARARIKELDSLILQAIDARNWSTADRLDVQRGKLWKQVDKLEGRKPRSNNPARSATLVAKRGGNPLMPEAKSRKPANFPYGVETRATENWGLQAAFKEKARAIEYAHALAAQYPRLPVRVIHYTGGSMK